MQRPLVHFSSSMMMVIIAGSIVIGSHIALVNEQEKKHVKNARIAQGLVLAQTMQLSVSEYYADRQVFPSSKKDIGYPEKEDFKHPFVSSINLEETGVISITFNGEAGSEKGVIRLVPHVVSTGFNLEWKCLTSDFKSIGHVMSTCAYQNP